MDNSNGSKINLTNKNKSAPIATDNNNNNSIFSGVDYYSDDFNAPNDTAALKARGYLVYRNGTFQVLRYLISGLLAIPVFFLPLMEILKIMSLLIILVPELSEI